MVSVDVYRTKLDRHWSTQWSRHVAVVVVMGAVATTVIWLQPAVPHVDRGDIYVEAVRRGLMIRGVRGVGTLVPEWRRWIPATTDGNVERIMIEPGAAITAESIIVELSNAELEQKALEAKLSLDAASARYNHRRVEIERGLLEQRALLASAEAQLVGARLQAEADEGLARLGLISAIQLRQSQAKKEEYETRYGLDEKRLQLAVATVDAQLAVDEAEVKRLRTLHELRRRQVEDLRVRAGMRGVLQQVAVEAGQRVMAGTNLARVGDPTVLKAELRIAETQAKDIQVGQMASIDTRNGVVAGHVSRIDPTVDNGTVLVDVALDGELPVGARSELTVDGTIEFERLEDVILVDRPVLGPENSVVDLFRMEEDGTHAVRTRVGLGRASVGLIEVVNGLQPGDRIIVSDMSMWEAFDRVRIN